MVKEWIKWAAPFVLAGIGWFWTQSLERENLRQELQYLGRYIQTHNIETDRRIERLEDRILGR